MRLKLKKFSHIKCPLPHEKLSVIMSIVPYRIFQAGFCREGLGLSVLFTEYLGIRFQPS